MGRHCWISSRMSPSLIRHERFAPVGWRRRGRPSPVDARTIDSSHDDCRARDRDPSDHAQALSEDHLGEPHYGENETPALRNIVAFSRWGAAACETLGVLGREPLRKDWMQETVGQMALACAESFDSALGIEQLLKQGQASPSLHSSRMASSLCSSASRPDGVAARRGDRS